MITLRDRRLARVITICALNFVACLFTLGCSISAKGDGNYAVTSLPGFILPELLAKPRSDASKEDIPLLMRQKWYASFNVFPKGNSRNTTDLSSCDDYFGLGVKKARTKAPADMSAYIELAIMCQAAQILEKAHPAKSSFIHDYQLTESTPEDWPAGVALEISSKERDRKLANRQGKRWSDVNQIERRKIDSPFDATFYHQGAVQEISLVGRGDFNDDGIEDLLITSRDSVVGGDYFNFRLFSLTKTQGDKSWRLLASYDW